MLRRLIVCFAVAAVAFPAAAAAHVTLQPGEWEAGSFARLAVRVPNERDDAETTRVTVQFPEEIPTARFQNHPFCEREVERAPLDEPIDDLTERIVSVTWTCDPAIAVDGFDEFGISLRVPEDAQPGDEILFPAVQVYSSGEEVGWVDPDPEADTPAPRLTIIPSEEDEAEEPAGTTTEADPVPAANAEGDDDSGMENAALGFGIAGLAAALIALAATFFWRPKTGS